MGEAFFKGMFKLVHYISRTEDTIQTTYKKIWIDRINRHGVSVFFIIPQQYIYKRIIK